MELYVLCKSKEKGKYFGLENSSHLKASFWGLVGLDPGNLIFRELKFLETYFLELTVLIEMKISANPLFFPNKRVNEQLEGQMLGSLWYIPLRLWLISLFCSLKSSIQLKIKNTWLILFSHISNMKT